MHKIEINKKVISRSNVLSPINDQNKKKQLYIYIYFPEHIYRITVQENVYIFSRKNMYIKIKEN